VVFATMRDNPVNAGIGLIIIAAGVPIYFIWRRFLGFKR
jgi:APA family basic amino acid/polyamine antiporter